MGLCVENRSCPPVHPKDSTQRREGRGASQSFFQWLEEPASKILTAKERKERKLEKSRDKIMADKIIFNSRTAE